MKTLHLLLTIPLILCTPPASAKDEVEIAFTQCPTAVQEAIKREAYLVKGTISKVERETKDHTTFFDAKIAKPDGTKLSVKVSAAGRVLEKKEKKEK